MNAGIAAYVILTQNTDVTDIVGVNVFPEVAEQETATPFIVYQLQSVAPEDTHDGPSKLDEVRFEFLCYADTYALAADLGDKVRGALDRVSGTYNGVNVESVQFNDVDIDTIDAPRRFAQVLTFTFRIKRDNFEIAQGTPVTGAMLGDLYDVDTTGVTDGQVIAYDAAAQEWQPADDAGGVTELGELDDVQFGQGGPEDGNVLLYDGDIWTNDTLQKSQIGLGNVDNTSDADKPVSSATQTALGAKANTADFSNVDNTSDADKPVSTATQTALNAKADTSAVPTDLNDLSDVSIVGAPAGNQALIYDATAGAFKSQVSYTNRFEDEVETGLQIPTIFAERGYSVKAEGDGIFTDPSSDTPTAGKVIQRKIYHKTGFISDDDVIGDYTLIHTFADDTAYADTVAVFDAFEDGATYGVPPFTLFQTWEEVTAAPAFTGLLNETYGSGAEAAYSTRRLNGNVTDCMVIRRASDSTTTTIGFVDGDIDEAAIETFCTGTTCTVSEWLDQSGNDNTATAAAPANEPTIYTGGELVKEDGKVALDFNNDFYEIDESGLNIDTISTFVIGQFDNTGASNQTMFALSDDTTNARYYAPFKAGALHMFGYAASFNAVTLSYNTNRRLFTGIAGSTIGNFSGFENGVLRGTATRSSYAMSGIVGIGGMRNSFGLEGSIQEVIYYNADKSANRTSIESNIGDYFTQNTPLLDTYTGAAAAYSLRKLRTAYTGDAVEVYNGSSYADIGFNVFGELDTVALAAHCGSNNGFVSKWYCQSGNSNDAAQTNTGQMPKIYDGTTGVVTENGKPALDFDGTNMLVTPSQSVNIGTARNDFAVVTYHSNSAVFNTDNVGGGRFAQNMRSRGGTLGFLTSGSAISLTPTQDVSLNTAHVVGAELNGTTLSVYVDGTQNGTTTQSSQRTGTSKLAIGTQYSTQFQNPLNGRLQELITYQQNKSSDRTDIESNINTFYDIY